MKKFMPIIIIAALAVVILCFAACGNDTMDDTMTSVSNELTSIMDDATTLDEALSEDMNELTDDMMTSGSDALGEDIPDVTDGNINSSDTTVATP